MRSSCPSSLFQHNSNQLSMVSSAQPRITFEILGLRDMTIDFNAPGSHFHPIIVLSARPDFLPPRGTAFLAMPCDRCFGDYCHFKDAWSPHRMHSSGSSSNVTHAAGKGGGLLGVSEANSSPISKVVSFRSILKSRAEEKALSAWSSSSSSPRVKATPGNGGWKGEPEHLPTLGGFGEGGGRNRQVTGGVLNS